MRALKIAGATVLAVIVVAALLLMIGIPSGFMTQAIQDRVERETGYRIAVSGATRLGIWPSLNVTLNDIIVQDPKARDSDSRLTIASVQAELALPSALSGHPQVSELVINKPVLYVPLRRERDARIDNSARPATAPGDAAAKDFSIDHIRIADGAVVFTNLRGRVESRIDGIDANAMIASDRSISFAGNARVGEHPLKFAVKAALPAGSLQRQNVAVELALDSPGLIGRSLSAKAQVRINGPLLAINGLSGTLDGVQFNGWASADLASKPVVKVDLDFHRLNLGTSFRGRPAAAQPGKPWSNEPINLTGLNYVDAEIRMSAAELNVGDARFAPAALDAALAGGVLKAQFSHLGVYGGEADGELTIDVSGNNPNYILRSDVAGVRALPLLTGLADFDKIDGKMQAKLAFRSSGASQRAIVSALSGTAFVLFQDGAIRDLNIARMIRSLTSGTLSGWQQGRDQTTDLTQLSASFRAEQGQATTNDLTLIGPLVHMTGAGTVDLSAKTLAFRVEPKLVMTTEGQGSAANPVGLGIPVVIEGPWAEPRIYPEVAGMLDNPDAAYAKLKEMGKGLFGPGGGIGSGGALSGTLGETLGNLLQQGLGSRSTAPASPQDQLKPPPPDRETPMDSIMKQLFGR
ncbi:AsmA family protein [Bradyrhizobium sp.]|jgi:AsmA protein|uniref:AsmA family protein n=1 Tax=Bradyrhizobium sp. TaxID=376 RepID=UPI002E06A00C|nr:AsmA family protein [Bradyrhizobium sp.]